MEENTIDEESTENEGNIEKNDAPNSEVVQVLVRVRGIIDDDKSKENLIRVNNNLIALQVPEDKVKLDDEKTFTFHAVFDETSETKDVYQFVYNLLDSVVEGYNASVLCYGATNSGKTYTMSKDPKGGLIQSVFPDLFEIIEAQKGNCVVRMAYFQIYKNEITDLLYTSQNSKQIKTSKKLVLRENKKKQVYVEGLDHHECKSANECLELYEKGQKNRTVGKTAVNKNSSRSHAILKLSVTTKNDQLVREGNLFLVDLAGAERLKKTEAQGIRQAEATKINIDMLALSKVITGLARHERYIPYRESKLTRILSVALGGNSKTVFIANVSPSADCYEESINVLRYAHLAKLISNVVEINEDIKDKIIRRLKEENELLKKQIEEISQKHKSKDGVEIYISSDEESDEDESNHNDNDNEENRKKKDKKRDLKHKMRQVLLNEEYIEQINRITTESGETIESNQKVKEKVLKKRKKAKEALFQVLRYDHNFINDLKLTPEEKELIENGISKIETFDNALATRMYNLILKQNQAIQFYKLELHDVVECSDESKRLINSFNYICEYDNVSHVVDYSIVPEESKPSDEKQDLETGGKKKSKACVIL